GILRHERIAATAVESAQNHMPSCTPSRCAISAGMLNASNRKGWRNCHNTTLRKNETGFQRKNGSGMQAATIADLNKMRQTSRRGARITTNGIETKVYCLIANSKPTAIHNQFRFCAAQ